MILALSLLLRVIIALVLASFLVRTFRHVYRLLRGIFAARDSVPDEFRRQAGEDSQGPKGTAGRPSIPRAEILPPDARRTSSPAHGPLGLVEYVSGPGALAGERVRIYGMAVIGRIADNDIVVEDPGASPRHAVIEYSGGSFEIRDLDSASGTYVNGFPVKVPLHLKGGETIRIGSTELRFM